MNDINLKDITQHYRVLGLELGASIDECRHARNKLMNKFHPDKHPNGWDLDDVSLEKRVFYIQSAYLYIMKNYKAIQKQLSELQEGSLTLRSARSINSHWAYKEVEKLTTSAGINSKDITQV